MSGYVFWGAIVAQGPSFGVTDGSVRLFFFFWHSGRVSDRPEAGVHTRGGGGKREREKVRAIKSLPGSLG